MIGCTPGEDVRVLQFRLNEVFRRGLGKTFLPLLVEDGIFGNKTKTRVAEFQKQQNLVADGVAGPKTQGRLDAIVGPVADLTPTQPAGGTGSGTSIKPGFAAPGGDPGAGKTSGSGKYGGGGTGGKTGGAGTSGTGGVKGY
jgi:peptidoglycan hydrolase-like protein with peptidoglycan-binding domain